MPRFMKGLGVTLLVLLLLAAIAISATVGWRPILGPRMRALTDRKFEVTPERQKRGAYLAEHVSGCTYCHSPSQDGPSGQEIVAAKKGSGQIFAIPGLPGTMVAPNITPDAETGMANWTDDQLARAIREGISHDGHALFPFMPYSHFRQMSDEDLASIVAYLRSLPPVRNKLPATKIDFPVKYLIRNAPEPVTEAVQVDMSNPVSRGKYLVAMAVCSECHTASKRGQPVAGMHFAGGQTFDLSSGKVASANITPDAATGIGNYTEEMFIKAMRTGYVGTRQLNTLMPWQFYSGQTDEDIKAMYAYLRTLPPVSHHVDNSKPATACRKCGAAHGAGDTN
jgi:mono/diheme cytochrome c family protein